MPWSGKWTQLGRAPILVSPWARSIPESGLRPEPACAQCLPALHLCRAQHQSPVEAQSALQTSGSPQGQAKADIPKDGSWIPEIPGLLKCICSMNSFSLPGGRSCLLPHKLNWKLEHVLLYATAAHGPVPPQPDPRVPGRNLTGFFFNILAPSLPLLLYIYSKKIKHHNTKLFPRDLI